VEARDLLAYRLGPARTRAEPKAVDEIIARCARLPLALAIACARASTRPGSSLAGLADELRDAAAGLDALYGGDPATDIRAVFSWSYRTLDTDAARLFRLLGLHPGPDVTAPAAASLAAAPPARVRRLLAELTRAHLLTEPTSGRYTFHDLLRAYAVEQTDAHDSAEQRHAATHRILDHYLHTAHAGALLQTPQRESITLAEPLPGVIPEHLNSHDAAQTWFTAEHAVLLAAVERAAAAGFDTHAWQLAWALRTSLFRRGLWLEQVAVQRIALAAARRRDDRVGQGQTLRSLAKVYYRLGRLAEADTNYRQALDVYVDLGDLAGQALTQLGLREVAERRGRLSDGLVHAERALDLYRATGFRVGQASALNAIGWNHAQLGDYRQALTCCQQALALLADQGYRDGEAATWDSVGYAHRGLGDYEQAAICYQHAIDLFRDLGDRYNEADALTSLGDTQHAAGSTDAARKAWHAALEILDQLGHPDADQVRGKLHR
jgi:tetratricopeptide (TPR) repeat protein